MDVTKLMQSLGLVCAAMYVIKFACDSFEGASDHLGKKVYKMKPGIRGATIEAIASSLPELFTTLFLLFLYHDTDGFSAGIATCAGSAVFNAAVIPAVCIIAVTTKGVNGEVINSVSLGQSTLLRDGFFFILAEVALIVFLGNTALAWWMGAALIGIYVVYFGVLLRGMGGGDDDDDDDDDDEEDEHKGFVANLLTFDYNNLIYGGNEFTKGSAWVVLICATATIGGACYFLAEAVIHSADALGVPAYFTAVILGAAATSVPDTVISYKDAMKGDYDDAVSNAVGSNIFDICVALGLPLLAYCLYNGSEIALTGGTAGSGAAVQDLRIILVGATVIILLTFLTGPRGTADDGTRTVSVGKGRGWFLGSLYIFWTAYIVATAMKLIPPFSSSLFS
ncbi:MAG: sodium:calcium antiporter [Myxococcota bacterium]|nr:sodium:calcium antiporter [Myxococcota bacterium]